MILDFGLSEEEKRDADARDVRDIRDARDAHLLGVSLRSFMSLWSLAVKGIRAFN